VFTTKLGDILKQQPNKYSTLQKILQKSSLQKEWTNQVGSLLKKPLRHEFTVTNVTSKHITIFCFNSSAATQLKFLTPSILEQLRSLKTFSQIEGIKIKVGQKM
tara:strand:- start:1279 stop:1590 length:312 start_codon:yes stop_codon:yes gene_type:complete